MASVWSSKIVSDILKAVDIKLEAFKKYLVSVIRTYPISPEQIPQGGIVGSKFANEAVSARVIDAESVFTDNAIIGTLTTSLIQSDLGERLNLESNEGISLIVSSIDTLGDNLEGISIYDSAYPPDTPPIAGKIWLDQGVEPMVLRRWLGADVPTDREYSIVKTGESIEIDNTKGDVLALLISAPSALSSVDFTYESETYTLDVGDSLEIVPILGMSAVISGGGSLSVGLSGSGWETVNDTSQIEENVAQSTGDIDTLFGNMDTIQTSLEQVAEIVIEPSNIMAHVKKSSDWKSTETLINQSAEDVSVVKTRTDTIDGRVKTIEESVIIDGATITLKTSESDYINVIDNSGWAVKTKSGETLAYAKEGKLGAERMFAEDAFIVGNMAMKDAGDGHVLFLRYGG